MKPGLGHHEDKLLELAYGELPDPEARAVQAHLKGCSQCSQSFSAIEEVRAAMAQLPREPAPEAGLDSLLAYAEQAARRAAAGPAPRPTWWRKLILPLAGAVAASVLVVIGIQVKGQVDTRLTKKDYAPKEEQAAAPIAAPAPEPAAVAGQPAVFTETEPQSATGTEGDKTLALRREVALADRLTSTNSRAPSKKAEERTEMLAEKPAQAELPAAAPPLAPSGATAQATARERSSLGLGLGSDYSNAHRGGGRGTSRSVPSSEYAAADEVQTVAKGYAPEDKTQMRAQEVEGLLAQARAFNRANDRKQEISYAQRVLALDARGYQRAEALKRLCDAFDDLGLEDQANPYCEALQQEFPATAAAKAVLTRRFSRSRAPQQEQVKKAKANTQHPPPAEQAAEPVQAAPAYAH